MSDYVLVPNPFWDILKGRGRDIKSLHELFCALLAIRLKWNKFLNKCMNKPRVCWEACNIKT